MTDRTKTYKVWIGIEVHNPRTDRFETLDLPYADAAQYTGRGARAQALDLADTLQRIATAIR